MAMLPPAPPVTPGVMVLLPAPFVMELPGDCCLGVPLALIPFTTLMFGPIMLPESEFSPPFTAPPVCAKAAKGMEK